MFNNQIIAGSSGQGGGSFYPYSIDQSLRVDDTASQRMYHNTVAGDAQKFTMSCWIKRTELSDNGTIMSSWNGASNFVNMYFSGDYLYCYICDNRSGFVDYNFTTYASPSGIIYYRDVSAWMHVVFAVDSTQSTATDRFTIWVNGVNTNARSAGSGNDIPLNYNMEINEAGGQNFLFNNPDSASYYGSFYIANMVYVDGTKYDADTFGEFNNGIWTPLDISTQSITYGNNGFYLDFADSSDLGKDVSGEGNHFTPGTRSAVVQNFSAHDQVPDSPTNNFATWNPLDKYNYTSPSEGNLRALTAGNNGTQNSTFAVSSGKWYFEVRNGTAGSATVNRFVGIAKEDTNISSTPYLNTDCYLYYSANGNKYNGSGVSYGDSWQADGDIIGIAFDADNGAIWFSKNGTWQNSATASEIAAGTTTNAAFTGLSGTFVMMVSKTGGTSSNDPHHANFGQDSTFAGATTAGGNADDNGYGDFKYAPPSGFLAMCSANIAEPTIGPNSSTTSDQHFNTVLYTGNGTSASSTQAITGVGFQPDFLWTKSRSLASGGAIWDVIRGDDGFLVPHVTNAENTTDDYLSSFDTDGFTVKGNGGNANANGETYVAWNWKAGGTAVSNTDGSITSSVSANPDAGFSIVSYTGTGANATVGHGLSSAPEMIIVKNRNDADVWMVYHDGLASDPETDYIILNRTDLKADLNTVWNDTAPTSNVFSIGSLADVNRSGRNLIAYCFHSSDVCKVGSYVGNGSTDGTFVYTGFRPAWVMYKTVDTTANNWAIRDNKRDPDNEVLLALYANLANADDTGGDAIAIDFLSNGFKARRTNSQLNQSGTKYIYLAFAEAPFKYANAR